MPDVFITDASASEFAHSRKQRIAIEIDDEMVARGYHSGSEHGHQVRNFHVLFVFGAQGLVSRREEIERSLRVNGAECGLAEMFGGQTGEFRSACAPQFGVAYLAR